MANILVSKYEVLKYFMVLFQMVVSTAYATAIEIHKVLGRRCWRFNVVVDFLALLA
jgi:hypothetical protein